MSALESRTLSRERPYPCDVNRRRWRKGRQFLTASTGGERKRKKARKKEKEKERERERVRAGASVLDGEKINRPRGSPTGFSEPSFRPFILMPQDNDTVVESIR